MCVSVSCRGMVGKVFACLVGVRPWMWSVGFVRGVGVVTGEVGLARLWVCVGVWYWLSSGRACVCSGEGGGRVGEMGLMDEYTD